MMRPFRDWQALKELQAQAEHQRRAIPMLSQENARLASRVAQQQEELRRGAAQRGVLEALCRKLQHSARASDSNGDNNSTMPDGVHCGEGDAVAENACAAVVQAAFAAVVAQHETTAV
jgi:hypothetical protein